MKLIVTAATLLLLVATAAEAQSPFYGGYRGGGYRGGGPEALGGAIIGGIIGGVITGAFAPRPQYYEPPQQFDAFSYCSARFRSWNPETGFYLAYSGEYRRCP